MNTTDTRPHVGETYMEFMLRTDPEHVKKLIQGESRKAHLKAERAARVARRLEAEEAARQATKRRRHDSSKNTGGKK